jgi:Tfp pilus assembly protein PilV
MVAKWNNALGGQSLVEVVVAVGIVLILVTGLIVATTFSLRFNQRSKIRTEALSYAEEGLEFVRQLRDADWNTVPSTGIYCFGIGQAGLEGEVPAGGCSVDEATGFTRTIEMSTDDVCEDPLTCKKVTASVSWTENSQMQSVRLSSYLTNWRAR